MIPEEAAGAVVVGVPDVGAVVVGVVVVGVALVRLDEPQAATETANSANQLAVRALR